MVEIRKTPGMTCLARSLLAALFAAALLTGCGGAGEVERVKAAAAMLPGQEEIGGAALEGGEAAQDAGEAEETAADAGETEPEDPGAEPAEDAPGKPPSDRAAAILSTMTLREKVCQLFLVFPTAVTGTDTATIAGEATRAGLAAYPVGGFLYDRGNLRTREQVRAMLEGTQAMSKIPLILTCDEEGGRVNRLMGTVGTPYVGPMYRYRDQGVERARENAAAIAEGLVSCGFNMDLAPVADVWSNRHNTVIGDRAYSDRFDQAAELVAAAVEGFHSGGVACVLKHFPGHGDTAEDSHSSSAYVHKTLEELREEEFLPFQAGIAAGAGAVMVGHLTVEAIDSAPAPCPTGW